MNRTILTIIIAALFSACNYSPCIKEDNSDLSNLSAWNDTIKDNYPFVIIDSIVNYVKTVTTSCNGKNSLFIPCEDRIAVFDMDGTIACEKPVSMETFCSYTLAFPLDTILDKNNNIITTTSGFKFTSSQLLDTIQLQIKNGELKISSDTLVQTYYKMTQSIYNKRIPSDNPVARPLSKQFYKPMVELICYLTKNDFKVYIVSGSAHQFIWAVTMHEKELKIDSTHILGSTIDLNPVYKPNEGSSFLVGETFTMSNVSKYKAINIHNLIGKTPILAFGNTVHDFDMFALTSSNRKYKTLCALLNHDSDIFESCYPAYDTSHTVIQDYTGQSDFSTGKWNSTTFDNIIKENNWIKVNMSKNFLIDSVFINND